MHKFSVDKASNGYVLWINHADDLQLLGPHIFLTGEEMLLFIEKNLV